MKPMNSETFGWNIPRKHVLFFHDFLDIVRVSPRMMILRSHFGSSSCELKIQIFVCVLCSAPRPGARHTTIALAFGSIVHQRYSITLLLCSLSTLDFRESIIMYESPDPTAVGSPPVMSDDDDSAADFQLPPPSHQNGTMLLFYADAILRSLMRPFFNLDPDDASNIIRFKDHSGKPLAFDATIGSLTWPRRVTAYVSDRTLFLQAQQFFDQFPNDEYHDLERQEQEQRFNVRLRLYYVNIFHFSDSLEQELDRTNAQLHRLQSRLNLLETHLRSGGATPLPLQPLQVLPYDPWTEDGPQED